MAKKITFAVHFLRQTLLNCEGPHLGFASGYILRQGSRESFSLAGRAIHVKLSGWTSYKFLSTWTRKQEMTLHHLYATHRPCQLVINQKLGPQTITHLPTPTSAKRRIGIPPNHWRRGRQSRR